MLAAGYKAPDVHGIPPAVRWTGRKGECDSRDLPQGVHCTARKPTSLGPAITVGRVCLQRSEAHGNGNVPIRGGYWIHPRLLLDLLVLGTTSLPVTSYAERLAKNLRMLRERMEEAQLAIHPFGVGEEVFLDTRLLPVGYANVSGVTEATTNSRKFQHPYAGPFKLLRKVGERKHFSARYSQHAGNCIRSSTLLHSSHLGSTSTRQEATQLHRHYARRPCPPQSTRLRRL